MRTFGTINGKKTFQQFIRSQNFHLQFMDNSAAQAKQDFHLDIANCKLQSIKQKAGIKFGSQLLNLRETK